MDDVRHLRGGFSHMVIRNIVALVLSHVMNMKPGSVYGIGPFLGPSPFLDET